MDATTKTRIRRRLIEEIDAFPSTLQSAAKYIVDNPNEFGLDSIRVTAEKIGISANSLVRLASHLGFDTFDELREPFRQALIDRGDGLTTEDWINRLQKTGAFGRAQAGIVRNEMDIVTRSLQRFSPALAERALMLMLEARNVWVMGTRASYALAYYFHYVGHMALPNLHLIPRYVGSPVDEMIDVSDEDVLLAVTFPPYSAETINALRIAKSKNTRIILLSDSELIAPNIEVDIFLRVSSQSTHEFACFAGGMAVMESLLALLLANAGPDAAKRIEAYQTLREDFGEYWKTKVPKLRR